MANATMANHSKIERVKSALETMSGTELKKVIQHNSVLRNDRSCRFLELPPELRNRIYRFIIQPIAVETHVMQGKAPALLKVNRQISLEFGSFYFSREFMTAELYNPSKEEWEDVKEPDVFRTMLRRYVGSYVEQTYKDTRASKDFMMRWERKLLSVSAEHLDNRRRGVFAWNGGPVDQAVLCCHFFSSTKVLWADRRSVESRRRLREAGYAAFLTR